MPFETYLTFVSALNDLSFSDVELIGRRSIICGLVVAVAVAPCNPHEIRWRQQQIMIYQPQHNHFVDCEVIEILAQA